MDIADYGPLLTAEAFLEIDFGERIKAELEDGTIRVLERGPVARVRVAGNLQSAIHAHFRGTGKRVYGSLLALKTGSRSVRFPDVAVYETDSCVAQFGDRDLMADPLLAVHVCGTDRTLGRLADEYRQIESLHAFLLVDYERDLVRSFDRTVSGDWREVLTRAGGSVNLQTLGLIIPHSEMFARD